MDDLDLLRDGDGDGTPRGRPWGLLAAALVAVLVAVSGLVWVAGSLTGGDPEVVPAAASPGTASPSAITPEPTASPAVPPTTGPTGPASPSATATSNAAAPPLPGLSPTTPRPAPTRATPTSTRRATLPPLPPPVGVVVPDVTGLRVPAATLVLRSAGFTVAVPGGTVAPRPDERRVRAQTPAAGTRAPRGATVTLLLDSS